MGYLHLEKTHHPDSYLPLLVITSFICHSSDYQEDFCPRFGPMHRFFSKNKRATRLRPRIGKHVGFKICIPKENA